MSQTAYASVVIDGRVIIADGVVVPPPPQVHYSHAYFCERYDGIYRHDPQLKDMLIADLIAVGREAYNRQQVLADHAAFTDACVRALMRYWPTEWPRIEEEIRAAILRGNEERRVFEFANRISHDATGFEKVRGGL